MRRRTTRDRSRPRRFIGIAVIVSGLIIAAGATRDYLRLTDLAGYGVVTQGVVTGKEEAGTAGPRADGKSEGRKFHLRYRFTLSSGQERQGQAIVLESHYRRFGLSDPIEIAYLEDDPEVNAPTWHSQSDRADLVLWLGWGAALAFAAIGAALLLTGGVSRRGRGQG